MKEGHFDGLICPDCKAAIPAPELESGAPPRQFACPGCGKTYAVRGQVPYFAEHLSDQSQTADTFGFAWTAFWKGKFDQQSVFGLKLAETAVYFLKSFGIVERDLDGTVVLDAGTGSGRVPMSLKDLGCLVCAVDIHGGLDVVSENVGSESVQFFQADVLNVPFRDGFCDYVWSSGVLHHTPNTAQAFAALAKKVKSGGKMFISVYGNTLHHYRIFRRLIPFSPKLPPSVNYALSAILALPLYVAFNTVLLVTRVFASRGEPPHRLFGFAFENVEHKSYFSIVLNLFDQLHPEFQREHSVEEVRQWFEENGFTDVVTTEDVGMVEMRGTKIGTPTSR